MVRIATSLQCAGRRCSGPAFAGGCLHLMPVHAVAWVAQGCVPSELHRRSALGMWGVACTHGGARFTLRTCAPVHRHRRACTPQELGLPAGEGSPDSTSTVCLCLCCPGDTGARRELLPGMQV